MTTFPSQLANRLASTVATTQRLVTTAHQRLNTVTSAVNALQPAVSTAQSNITAAQSSIAANTTAITTTTAAQTATAATVATVTSQAGTTGQIGLMPNGAWWTNTPTASTVNTGQTAGSRVLHHHPKRHRLHQRCHQLLRDQRHQPLPLDPPDRLNPLAWDEPLP